MERSLARLALMWLLLAGAPATAQVPPAPEPATTTGAAAADGTDLAFLTAEERMTVPVTVAGAGPFPFVVDTGAQRSVISRQLARHLGLPAGRRLRLTAMSGTAEVESVLVPALSVGTGASAALGATGVEAPALEAHHLGAPGMLGIDALQGCALAIDFDRQQMTVTPAARRPGRRSAPDEIVIRAKSLFGQLVVTDASMTGRRVRVVLDTGTAVTMGNSALRRLLTRRVPANPAVFTSVLGEAVTADYVQLSDMTLGSATIRALNVAFADAAPFRVFGLENRPALLLGMDALRLFRRVHIDFANRELRLVLPRDALRRPAAM